MKKILNSVLSQIIYIFVSALIGLALVPITIKMLGTIQYGAFELILSLILIDTFLEFGLGSTLVKYIPEFKHNIAKLKSFVWSYYYIKLFLTFLGFLVIVSVGYNFDKLFNLEGVNNIQEIKLATYIFGIGLIINSITSFLDNFLKGFVYFGLTNSVRIFSTLLFFLSFYIYYIENDVYSIIYIALIWFVLKPLLSLSLIIILLKYLKLTYILKPVPFNKDDVKSTLKYMYAMTYIVMVAQLYNRMPKIVLGIFTGPVYVAYWGVMEKIKEPLIQLEGSMIRPLIPILSDKKNIVNMTEQKTLQAIRLQYLFMSFLGIMTITHIDLFINLWIGIEYKEVAILVKIILLSFLFPKAGILLMMYYAEGKTKINTIFVTLNSTISLSIGTVTLIITNDIELFAWAFVTTLILMTTTNILKYINYFNLNKVNFIKNSVVLPAIITMLFYSIYLNIAQYFDKNLFGLLYSLFVSFIIYIVLLFFFINKEDKSLVMKFLKRKNN